MTPIGLGRALIARLAGFDSRPVAFHFSQPEVITMRVRHATPARNLPSILRRGVLASKSLGSTKSVWLCSPGLLWWAVLHTARRKRCDPDSVAVVEIEIPRSWLKRGKGKGKYHTGGLDIPPAKIVSVVTLAQMSL